MPSQCLPESFCIERWSRPQSLGFQHALSGQQLLHQKVSNGSHEVLWAVGVDPVPSVRHDMYLGLREESPNLRVVAGTGEIGRKKEN